MAAWEGSQGQILIPVSPIWPSHANGRSNRLAAYLAQEAESSLGTLACGRVGASYNASAAALPVSPELAVGWPTIRWQVLPCRPDWRDSWRERVWIECGVHCRPVESAPLRSTSYART